MRKIEALNGVREGNQPGSTPKFVDLSLAQLIVNDEDYQRGLTESSKRMIRKMARAWDWASYKAPNVAATEDPKIFEILDGQHTAIAAATNGNIPLLPCLVVDAETVQRKAAGFIGINKNRIPLTNAAIWKAQVAAGDEAALAVKGAVEETGCTVMAVPPTNGKGWNLGETIAVGTLMDIAKRRGSDRLASLLKVAVDAGAAPVSAMTLKALDLAIPADTPIAMLGKMATLLKAQGIPRLEMMAKGRTDPGKRAYETLADMLADFAKLPAKRMGIIRKKERTGAPKAKVQSQLAEAARTARGGRKPKLATVDGQAAA